MATKIQINFTSDDIHRIRNFGEDLYHLSLNSKDLDCSIDEIDRATDTIIAVIGRTRHARRVVAKIEELLDQYNFAGTATVTLTIAN